MALPVYVINFEELVKLMAKGVSVEIDTTDIENLLKEYFPELMALLSNMGGYSVLDGTQKIKGFATKGEAISFVPDKDIVITGVTFSQSEFDRMCMDQWMMKVRSGDEEVLLLDGVYAKDTLQHKYFERAYPVAAGYEIIINPVYEGDSDTVYWFDLEYIYDPAIHYSAPNHKQPAEKDYLKMFIVTDAMDSCYVNPDTIALDYPSLNNYWDKTGTVIWTESGILKSVYVPEPFYEGRNTIRTDIFYQSSANSGSVTDFHRYLWKLREDSIAGLIIPELDNGFTSAAEYMAGIGLTDIAQQVSIYMTYHTKVTNLVFNSFISQYVCGDNLDGFIKHVQKSKCFVFDWIDWCDVIPDSDVGGFATSWDAISGFKSCLNIEPQIKNFPIDGNGVQKVFQYKFIGTQVWLYTMYEGKPDPYREYSWDNITDSNVEKEAMLAHVTIHEMGHSIDSYAKYRGDIYNLAYTDEWINIWKWDTVATKEQLRNPNAYMMYPKYLTNYHMDWNMDNGEPPLTPYGCSDICEDFAESYACYITNRRYLKEKYPKRYAFMQTYVDTMEEMSV